ncbi:pyruvate dehydrogenase (acetyl-transferring) E1 component subunit alpha [Nakamurella sp. YIM 132087]|uniref:2-oxoisovalerate dehydrogenase subunit alpha n=1 Tax=Nakamurella alba TaxID=2665158 RepID=A0A7K1FI33_9ACTN|nr:thiamine pyrophosphate-dependent enzyme [Nakamurella alba]MTD12544.1 pyruvate dehydrogenase (acetyl-transferring) E1 component subunit alpha [Nakamurella alba]
MTSTLAHRVEILLPDGSLAPGAESPLSDDEVIDALGWMILSRTLDARLISLQRQGRMGTFSAVHGQEAAVVGAAIAVRRGHDWMVPAYREAPAMILHGYPLENFILYWRGNMAGGRVPDNVRMLPTQIALGAQIPHAVGLAWGRKLQQTDEVVLTYFGDGASSEGDFHEALNLAGVVRAPVVFALQNNGWAISTPRSRQTAAESFAARAAGYGIPGVLVDGNDLFAVHAATRDAVERARRGEGATLLELQTVRMGAHNTADDPSRYVPEDPATVRDDIDPITRVTRYLARLGLWDDARAGEMQTRADAEIDRALAVADAYPAPDVEGLFTDVYHRPSERLLRQRRQALQISEEDAR